VNNNAQGFANALQKGFSQAKGELLLPLMGDGCDNIDDINLMYEKMRYNYACVCASRYTKSGRRLGGSQIKGFFSRFVGLSLFYIIRIPTKDVSNAFKMYKRELLDKIKLNSKGFEISMEFVLKIYFRGYRIAEIPTIWKERSRGSSSFKLLKEAPSYLKLYILAIGKRLFLKNSKLVANSKETGYNLKNV
jgi:dolichol-phosphate mannosyltransferase